MEQQSPHAKALQEILNNEIGRRLFSSFPIFNNAYFVKNDALKADSALSMLNEKLYPSIILSEITNEEKKIMFMEALNVNLTNLKEAYEVLIDFILQKQTENPSMQDLQKALKIIAPNREKK